MAWITVDQSLLGGKLRELTKRLNCSQNETIGLLIRLWLWGVDNAGKSGEITAADREDIEDVIRPGFLSPEESRSPDAVSNLVRKLPSIVQTLIDCQWIDEVDGKLYLHDWVDWSQYYTSYIDGKEKHAARMREYRKAEKQGEKKRKRKPYADGFEKFWAVYPRKVEKGNAYKKYNARLNDGFSEEQLLEAAQKYADQCRSHHTEQRYIKHATTFLSDTMPFADFLDQNPIQQKETLPQGENPFL